MSAFYCPECNEYKNPDTAISLDDKKFICEDCYSEHLCECGEEMPQKKQGDMCDHCMMIEEVINE